MNGDVACFTAYSFVKEIKNKIVRSRFLLVSASTGLMADFDERSGIVSVKTSWGLWYQTLDEVSLEINVDTALKSKEVDVKCYSESLSVNIRGQQLFSGPLHNMVVAKAVIWTLETEKGSKMLRIVLQKQDTSATNTWSSLLKDEFAAEEWLYENMKKKAALEKMQLENPGFDMSGAEITGHYATGGPDIPT